LRHKLDQVREELGYIQDKLDDIEMNLTLTLAS
jgi:hypothetical protein